MWSEAEIEKYLKGILKEGRFKHSLSVRDTAVKLAKMYSVNVDKARIAGLVHDCAKNMSDEEILALVKKKSIVIDEISLKAPQLLHGVAGAFVAETVFGVHDTEILDAISYHTTGRKNMTLLDKIIYIADYVEPLRNFDGVDKLRKSVHNDLNEALLLCCNNTINYVISKGELLHQNTVDVRNDLLLKFCFK